MIYSSFLAQADSSAEVVDNAEKGELQSIAPEIDIADKPITEHSFEPGKWPFHCATNTTLTLIGFLLFLAQGLVSFAFVQNAIINTGFPKGTFPLIVSISFVAKYGLFITTDQLLGLLAVMHTGRGETLFADYP